MSKESQQPALDDKRGWEKVTVTPVGEGPALEILLPPVPESPVMTANRQQQVEHALDAVSNKLARRIDPSPINNKLLDPNNLVSPQKIADMLGDIEDGPEFKVNLDTKEGVVDAAAHAEAKAKAASEIAPDAKTRKSLAQFIGGVGRGVSEFMTRPPNRTRNKFVRTVPIILSSILLAACGVEAVGPVAVPDGGAPRKDTPTLPASSETSTAASTETATATSTPAATETATATATETFEPIDLGTQKKHTQCTVEDYNGRIQAEEHKILETMKPQAGATLTGYELSYANSSFVLSPEKGSSFVTGEPISYCDIIYKGKKLTVVGVPWLNKDGSLSVLHIALDDSGPRNVQDFISIIKKSNGTAVVIYENVSSNWKRDYGKKAHFEYFTTFYDDENPDEVFKLTEELRNTGNVPKDLEYKILLSGMQYPY